MKMLFYISTIRGGGAARVMVNLANEFAKNNEVWFVTNFCADHEYLLDQSVERRYLEVDEMRENVFVKNWVRISKLREIIKSVNPDVCISFMGENNFRMILSTVGIQTKRIVSVRNDPNREYPNFISRALARLLYRFADGVVFQTVDAKKWFSKSIQEKSEIIINQVDEAFYHQSEEIGKYIIASGRLSKQKNYPMLLRAFRKVKNKFKNQELLIYGEGTLKDELVGLSKELEIADSVHFMGFSQNMEEAYRNARFLVMTSDYEGLPNVILEAFASSIPAISTDCPCGGPKMLIKDGVNGFLVPVANEDILAERMEELLRSDDLVLKMKREAFAFSKTYDKSTIFAQWDRFIRNRMDC